MFLFIRWACTFVVAGNEKTRLEISTHCPGLPVLLMDAGIDCEALDCEPQLRDNDLAVFIGRLVSQKGVLDLAGIMARVWKVRPGMRLVIVGTGPEESLLREKLGDWQGRVEIMGNVSDEAKAVLLRRAGWFFFPSYEEGWGIALGEALACGCKCVAYRLAHYEGIFNQWPAYARLGDVASFAAALNEFERETGYEQSWRETAQADFMERYDRRKCVDELFAKLDKL